MKIAIDISQIVYGTGVSIYTINLVKALLKIDQKNEYLLFASSLRQKKRLNSFKMELEDLKNVQFKFLNYPLKFLEIAWGRLKIMPIDKFISDVDVFHSSDWLQPTIKSQVIKRVTTIHDMVPYLFPTSMPAKIVSNQKRRLQKVKNEVDTIIVDSNSTKEDVVKFLEIPESKIEVIYLAPPDDFKPQDDEIIKETLQKYKIKKPYILSVATQEPRKNIQKLIDAFAKVQEDNVDISLVLAGKYGWGPGLRTQENVIWTDYIPQEDLIKLYCGSRVFVYPSLYEGFGLPILEAMACGAPVITSNNSSMAEIAKDTAILIDPRNENQLVKAINMVLGLNLENYQRMVKASLDNAHKYTWAKVARETLRVYEKTSHQDNKTN